MEPALKLAFLGGFHVTLGDQPITHFRSDKVRALLAYLAVEAGQPHPRTTLATLLWPDMPDQSALRNLSQTLARLRQVIPDPPTGAPFLVISRREVQLNPDSAYHVDVSELTRLVAGGTIPQLEQAATLYQGDFLAGFSLPDSELFEEWALLKREGLHRQALDACYRLAAHHEQAMAYDAAEWYARRQLELEPWREEAHQQLMRVLALSGQRSAALAQYEACRRLLAEELGVEPAAETVALYERIRADELSRGAGEQRIEDRRSKIEDRTSRSSIFYPLSSILDPLLPGSPAQDWGEAPDVGMLYGRQAELDTLARWLVDERCRLVAVLGMGGMGKTVLAAQAVKSLVGHFDYVFWRSLLNAPPLDEVLRGCLRFLSGHQLASLPDSLNEQLGLLFDLLRRQRCLVVLDNTESILQSGDRAGHYRPGYEAYGQLIQRMGETVHQSCLLLTSRERPQGFKRLEGTSAQVRSLPLAGLTPEAGLAMVQARGLAGSGELGPALIKRYSGHPLALMLVSNAIQELFAGDVAAFLSEETLIFDDIRDVLDQQFGRLSPLERSLLLWLAIEREAISAPALRENLIQLESPRAYLEALRSLQRRSLLEKQGDRFTLQNVVIEYATDYLVEQVCREIEGAGEQGSGGAGISDVLNRHALLKAQAKEYIRQSQARLILQPIARRLVAQLGLTGLEEKLRDLLAALRAATPRAPGYAGGNLLNLLLHLGVDVRGYDFSRLNVWQAYLRGVTLPEVNFAGADLARCVFTDTFGFFRCIALSPDGQWLAAGMDDGEIRLWQAGDGQPHGIYKGHSGHVPSVAFSPDGQTLASGSADQTIRLWDVGNPQGAGQVCHTLHGHHLAVFAVGFSPDGQTLASGGEDATIRLWDAGTGQALSILHGHRGQVLSVVFSPDGQTLASGSLDHTVRLWDARTGQVRYTLAGHTDAITEVAFSPNGNTVVSSSMDHTMRLWDARTGQALNVLEGHTNWVQSVAFHPDGQTLASGSADQTVRLWDVRTGQILNALHGHMDAVHTVVFSPDGQTLTSGSFDQTIRVWEARTGQCLKLLQGHTQAVHAIAFSPDGETVASGSSDHMLRVWNARTGQCLKFLAGHTQAVHAIAFSSDGRTLASGGTDRTVRLWDVRSGQVLNTLLGHTQEVTSVAFSPTGKLVASSSDDRTIRLWDARTGQVWHILHGHAHMVESVVFSPDGQTLASGSFDRTVRLWEAGSGQTLNTLSGHTDYVWCVAFSPDGKTLASGSFDRTVRLWEAQSGQTLQVLPGHAERVFSVAFSPDGRLLATGSADRTVRLWDVHAGQVCYTLEGHTGWVNSVAFSPDGQHLVSGSTDETIKVWDVRTGECLRTLRAEGPYAGMNIAGVTGITEAQKAALKALGAVELSGGTGECGSEKAREQG